MSALLLFGLVHASFLALFVGALFRLEQPTHRLVVLVLVVAASTGVTAQLFGIGQYWSVPSFVGKLAANAGASACPPVGAWLTFSAAARATPSAVGRSLVSLVGGAAGIVAAPLVGLGLACSLTGDCL